MKYRAVALRQLSFL